jgi:hypothetical protein
MSGLGPGTVIAHFLIRMAQVLEDRLVNLACGAVNVAIVHGKYQVRNRFVQGVPDFRHFIQCAFLIRVL